MSTLETVQEARQDLEQLQVVIGAVSTGLDAVETAIEVSTTARHGVRRAFRIVAVIGLAAVAAYVMQRACRECYARMTGSPTDDPDAPMT